MKAVTQEEEIQHTKEDQEGSQHNKDIASTAWETAYTGSRDRQLIVMEIR